MHIALCRPIHLEGGSPLGGSLATQSGTRKYRNGLAKVGKYWWVCLKRGGKKVERSTGCTSRSDAEKVRDALRTQLGLGKHGIDAQGPFDVPSLELAVREWQQANAEVVSGRYLEQMAEMVQIHLGKWKDLPLNEITTEIVEKARKHYLANKGKKTLKGTTFSVEHSKGGANRLVRLLSALYGWAIRSRKYLKERPWHLSEVKVQQRARAVVWPEQVRPFLAAVGNTTRSRIIALSIRMQIGLGLRESETGTAEWEWVDWRNATYMPGKTKNRKVRQIPIPQWLMEELRREWERQGRPSRGLLLRYGKGESLGKSPVYRGFTKNAIRIAGESLKIRGLHPHRLRATFATAHFETGTTLQQIMLMMGHDKPQTTLRYIETRPKEAAKAQDRVAEAMGFAVQATQEGTPQAV